jgi:hypothetical protein
MAVAASPTLAVVFSEAMNPATITSNSDTSCSGSVQLSSDGFATCVAMSGGPATADAITFTLAAQAPLASAASYTLRVTSGAQDVAGNALAGQSDSTFVVRYAHTIVIDGVNDFAPSDEIATSTVGAKLYLSHDDTHLYLGLEHVDIGGSGDKFAYFLLSTDATLASGNSTSSDGKASFGAGKKMMHHWKEQIAGAIYSEYRSANGVDWSTVWGNANKQSFRAPGYLEGSIALSELGSPQDLAVTAYTVDYSGGGGAGWLYNMLSGATDMSAATPVDLTSYVHVALPTSLAPNDPSELQAF